jgi:hypothetical protein
MKFSAGMSADLSYRDCLQVGLWLIYAGKEDAELKLVDSKNQTEREKR